MADHGPLRYAQPPDLGPTCRPLPRVDVLTTQDERVGEFDGVLLSATSDDPLYLVLLLDDPAERRLVPVGEAWFDQTAGAIRLDEEDVDGAAAFDRAEFERMSATEVAAFERRVLASCCPEVLRDAGAPGYDAAPEFQCPEWLRA